MKKIYEEPKVEITTFENESIMDRPIDNNSVIWETDKIDQYTYENLKELLVTSDTATQNSIIDMICESNFADFRVEELYPYINESQKEQLRKTYR